MTVNQQAIGKSKSTTGYQKTQHPISKTRNKASTN